MMASDVRITVLVDNEAGEGLVAEHGLSFWIETAGKRILFDTGQGDALRPNARRLGVPLNKADVIVLSHGHYDHADGLPDVVAQAPQAQMVVHPDAFVARYSIHPSRPARAVGIAAAARAAIEQLPVEKVIWSDRPVSIAPQVGVTGPIARATDFEDVGGPFFLDEGGQEPDPITDDQALWIETAEGLVVCVGCCHAGLINTLQAVRRASGISRIRAVIGGFHLLHAGQDRLERTVDALRSMAPQTLIPCHCTGSEAQRRLRESLGESVLPCCSGATFSLTSESM